MFGRERPQLFRRVCQPLLEIFHHTRLAESVVGVAGGLAARPPPSVDNTELRVLGFRFHAHAYLTAGVAERREPCPRWRPSDGGSTSVPEFVGWWLRLEEAGSRLRADCFGADRRGLVARRLVPVHRPVGDCQELVSGRAVVRIHRDADAGFDGCDSPVGNLDRDLVKTFLELEALFFRAIARAFGENDDELVSAVSGAEVVGAKPRERRVQASMKSAPSSPTH